MRYLKLSGLKSPFLEPNLRVFETVSPHLKEKILTGPQTRKIGLAITEDGSVGALCVSDNKNYWVQQPGSVQKECDAFMQELQSKNFSNYDLFILAKFGLGLHWRVLRTLCRRSIHNYGIIVVEPDPGWLFAAAGAYDLSKDILDSNTFWVTGTDWQSELETLAEREFLYGYEKSITLPGHPQYAPFHRDEHRSIKETVHKILSAKRASFDDDVRVFAAGRKRRNVCSIRRLWSLSDRRTTNRVLYQVSEPLLEAFDRIGVEVQRSVREGTKYYSPLTSLREFMESDADAFFSVNDPFTDVMFHPLSPTIEATKIIWYVDHPYYLSEFPTRGWENRDEDPFVARLHDHHIFLYDASDRFVFLRHGITPAGYLPHSAAFLDVQVKESPEYLCDVCFAGTLYSIAPCFQHLSMKDSATCMEYVNSMADIVYRNGLLVPHFDGLFEENPPPPVLKRMSLRRLSKLIHLEADNRLRIDCAKALAAFDFRLFGDRNWLDRLGDHPAKNAWRERFVFDQIPIVYKSSKINVNVNSRQLRTAHTNRTFNIIGLDRLVLSNYFEGMEHIFPPGLGIDYFTSFDELKEKVEYYLTHADERENIARRGREAILREHRPEDRAQFILETVCERIRQGTRVYRSYGNWNPPDYDAPQSSPVRFFRPSSADT